MTKRMPPDMDVREKIENELAKNFLVEAGAGSGKTSSLVKRMLSVVASGRCAVGELTAVTFTRKAAAELRERFQTRLEEVYREAADPEVKERLEQALIDIDRCFLGTIHSFCARLLRERPVEAGLDPEFTELDDLEDKLLQDQAWDSYLLEVKLNNTHLLDKLNQIGIGPLELKGDFVRLNTYPDVEIVYDKLPKPDIMDALNKLVSLVYRANKAIPTVEPDKGYDKLQSAVRRVLRYLNYFDMNRETNIIKILTVFEKGLGVTQNRWNSTALAKQFRDEFDELAVKVIGPTVKQWREYCHYHIMEFLLPAVRHYERMRQEQSYLNYEDLLIKTAAMLRNNPEVRGYFQSKYKCLLIDEFQDTDPVQAEIMFYLTGEDTNEKEWQQITPRPGSLFVVGDPKQSIYRFRRADIDTYNLVKERIMSSGGEVLKLTANFRSFEALGSWFNPTFQKLLAENGDMYQAEFSYLHTMLPDQGKTALGVRVLDIPNLYTRKADIVDVDADYIARIIKDAISGNLLLARTEEEKQAGITEIPRPKDFMILLRYKDSMQEYARALERYGIPVRITGGSSMDQCHELRELFRLLRFLADTENKVLFVAVLRGLFFGISDNSLYQLKKAGGSFSIFSSVPDELDEEVRSEFLEAFSRLKKYYGWTREYAPTVALEKMITDLGIVPYTLAGEMGKSRCGYVYQVLELLRRVEADGKTGFSLMVEQFATIMENAVEEELNVVAEEEDTVRIMNLHKAKGLEAPVVFLAHPFKRIDSWADQHIKRVGQSPKGYLTCSRSKGESQSEVIGQPLDWEKHEEEELKYLAAEEIRLLYVAATRAKNLLVISRSLKDANMKKNPWALLFDDELETIPVPGIAPVEKFEVGEEISPDMLETARSRFSSWIPDLTRPGYMTGTPTGLKNEQDQPEIKRLAGGGMAWGSVIHKLLEEAVKGTDDLETAVALALKENGVDVSRKDEALAIVKNFKQSELWQRILAAEVRLTEVPFTIKIEQGHPLYEKVKSEYDVPVILSGVIDLVLKESDGWVIIDYKTDRVEDEGDMKQLLKVYSQQVVIYCGVWEDVTGEQVKNGILHFSEWDGGKTYILEAGNE